MLLSIGLLMGLPRCLQAQPFSIDWSSVDGGGGTSTGGVYSVSSTIGQSDAGVMSGGPYSVTGGYWSGVVALQTPGAPILRVERLPGGLVRIFWPLPATGYVLELVSALNGPPVTGWLQVPPAAYRTNATHISLTVSAATAGQRFFRLRH